MSQILTDPIVRDESLARLGLDAYDAPTGQVWGAQAEEAWEFNPLGGLSGEYPPEIYDPRHPLYGDPQQQREREGLRALGQMLGQEEANKEFGIPGELSFDTPEVPRFVAEDLHRFKREELQRRDVFSRARGGAVETAGRVAIGFGVSALDPINVASAFIPVVGEARYALWANRFGRTFARTARGAIEGAAGAAIVEPLVLAGAHRRRADDYDAVDSLLNIGFGGALGGGLHVAVGALTDRLAGADLDPHVRAVFEAPQAARETALRGAVAALAEDRPVRVGQVIRPEWPAEFPRVVLQTRGDLLTGNADYAAARAGDVEAARRLVGAIVKDDKVAELAALLGDASDVVVLPVRSASGNALPAAYAELLATRLGATLGEGVAKAAGEPRRGAAGIDRFSQRSTFAGPVESGKRYLLVDDYVTQGGTLADLRAFVEGQGGKVVAATTLAGSRASDRLAPAAGQVGRLREAMPETERLMRARLGYGFEGLTDSELDALARSSQDHVAALMADQTRLQPDDAAAAASVDRRTQANLATPAEQQPALDQAAIERQVERLAAEAGAGRVDAADAGALAEADELLRQAEASAKDYQAAAACLLRSL